MSREAQPGVRALTVSAAVVWTLLAVFLDLLVLANAEAAREGTVFDLVARTACQAIAYSVVFFGILRIHEPDGSIREILAVRRPMVLAAVLGLGLGAALAMPSEWIDQLVDRRFPRPLEEAEALERILSVATVGKRVALVATLAVIQPLLDELFFRGALFTPLARTRRIEVVILATAALETFSSMSPRAIPTLAVATLVFAWLRASTGSIWPAALARMAYYGVALVPIALGHEAPKPTRSILLASAAVGTISALGLGWLARRRATIARRATAAEPS